MEKRDTIMETQINKTEFENWIVETVKGLDGKDGISKDVFKILEGLGFILCMVDEITVGQLFEMLDEQEVGCKKDGFDCPSAFNKVRSLLKQYFKT